MSFREQGGREYLHFFDGSYLNTSRMIISRWEESGLYCYGYKSCTSGSKGGNIIAFTMKLGGEDGEEDLSVDDVNLDRLNYTTALF